MDKTAAMFSLASSHIPLIFSPLINSTEKTEYRFAVEGVQSRENAVTFIQFLFCGDANFINELDKYYNEHIAQRAKFFSERIYNK